MSKVKLAKRIKITIPNDGEKYGVETLIAVAKFGIKTITKVNDFKKDGKYSLLEKVRSISILTGAVKLGERWKDIRNEFFDQDENEQRQVIQVLIDKFNWTYEVALEYYVELVDFMILVYEFLTKDRNLEIA